MKVVEGVCAWRSIRRTLNRSIGFVPTMGAIHAGHSSLMTRSVAENDLTVVSIYVNPTQFDNSEDLARYPKTLTGDLAACEAVGVDYVVTPTYDEIYADGFRYQIDETQFSRELCGAHRAGHFTGVLTVVMKLLNIIKADRAYFGEKDYQQFLLIRDMVDAFFMDVEIIACATVRERDGLALSSRNALLSCDARKRAAKLNKLLRSPYPDEEIARKMTCLGFDVDYITTTLGRRFVAASLNGSERPVRLIDNVEHAG